MRDRDNILMWEAFKGDDSVWNKREVGTRGVAKYDLFLVYAKVGGDIKKNGWLQSGHYFPAVYTQSEIDSEEFLREQDPVGSDYWEDPYLGSLRIRAIPHYNVRQVAVEGTMFVVHDSIKGSFDKLPPQRMPIPGKPGQTFPPLPGEDPVPPIGLNLDDVDEHIDWRTSALMISAMSEP